jgi:ketosteroid isomerase-like protein
MRSTADQTVSGIIEKWSASFNKLDADALASLYSKNAFFFGSNPSLYCGHEGVAAYFNALQRWSSPTVQFTDVRTAPVGADLINFAGTAIFRRQRKRAAAVGEDNLGGCQGRRRLENCQSSRLVQDATDR